MNLRKDRKSTKNLDGGPMISGKEPLSGQVKKGYSVPHHVLESQKDYTHGSPSFFKKEYTEIKEIIENKHLKQTLLDKVKSDLISGLDINKKVKQDWRNKAFQVR